MGSGSKRERNGHSAAGACGTQASDGPTDTTAENEKRILLNADDLPSWQVNAFRLANYDGRGPKIDKGHYVGRAKRALAITSNSYS